MASFPIEVVISETLPVFSRNTCLVIDWDDTLMLTNWCVARGAKLNSRGDTIGVTAEMLRECSRVAPYVEKLVLLAKQLGSVMIVTNASKAWVEASCSTFMPSIRHLIMGIPIISAADLYEKTTPDTMAWKRFAFRKQVLQTAFGDSPVAMRTMVSIGDGEAERHAARSLLGIETPYGQIIPKTIKFSPSSYPDNLIAQLEAVTKLIPLVLLKSSQMDLSWNYVAFEDVTMGLMRHRSPSPPKLGEIEDDKPLTSNLSLQLPRSAKPKKVGRSTTPYPRYETLYQQEGQFQQIKIEIHG